MRTVSPPDKHTTDSDCRAIESAIGYMELGMFDDSHDEIESLSPALYSSKAVLSLRASLYSEANWWGPLHEVARVLVNRWPGDCDHWILLGCASRRCVSIAESDDVFLEALIFHEFEPLIYFHLACNSAHVGNWASARHQLTNALLLDPDIAHIAMEDPDLAPVWIEMEQQKLQSAELEIS
jgi:hypothetical protein